MRPFPPYPVYVNYARGGLINNTPFLCGGRTGNDYHEHVSECYKYEQSTNEWTELFNLDQPWCCGASTTLKNGSVWITGNDPSCITVLCISVGPSSFSRF